MTTPAKPYRNTGYERYGYHPNSMMDRVLGGDEELLAAMGCTQEEAKRRMNAYLKNAQVESQLMEKWYHQQVQQKRRGEES